MFNFVKKITLGLILLFHIQASASNLALPTGGTDVWPFDKELEFPWENISGIWFGENKMESVTFSFDVGTSDGIHREINVTQISERKHRPLATGTVVVENNIGSGLMMTTDGNYFYNITVRLVQKKNATEPNDKKYTVVTVEPLMGELSGSIFHFEMIKMSEKPLRKSCNYKKSKIFAPEVR